jgi:hypothetical protein
LTDEKSVKEEKTLKKSDKGIMLITFKDTANIDNITYAGFKAHINANDEDKFKESDLKKKLDSFKNKSAFKI